MNEESATASTVISFAEKLEQDSAKFYENLAQACKNNKDMFLEFAKENKRNKLLLTTTYRETVSDALETCFAFEGLNLSCYEVTDFLPQETDYSSMLKKAIRIENTASKFYSDAATLSKDLLATIPKAFHKIAEQRKARKAKLEMLEQK